MDRHSSTSSLELASDLMHDTLNQSSALALDRIVLSD